MNVARDPTFGRALRDAAMALLLLLTPAATAVAQQTAVPELLVKWPDTIYVNGVVASFDNTKVNNDPGTLYQAVAVRDGEGAYHFDIRLQGAQETVFFDV